METTDKTTEPTGMNYFLNLVKRESAIVIVLVGCLLALGTFTKSMVDKVLTIVETNTAALNSNANAFELLNSELSKEIKEVRQTASDIQKRDEQIYYELKETRLLLEQLIKKLENTGKR